jgi:hypothetical protein
VHSAEENCMHLVNKVLNIFWTPFLIL